MNSSANSHGSPPTPRHWRSSLVAVLLVAFVIYIWIVPLFRPRGEFLWGYYRLKDIYLGIPIALAAICVIVVLIVPARYKRTLSFRLTTLAISILVTFAICDAGYAFAVNGAWKPDYWLDQGHISRRHSAADSELGFVRKPFVSWQGYVPYANRFVEYRSDENGFRNPPGQRRADVVFIGDSYTEAGEVAEENTFVRRVAQSTGLSAVNLGRGAYGPQQELIVLKRYGLSYQPRVVVWQLFEGNDLLDAEVFAAWIKNPHQVNTSLKQRYLDNSLLTEWLTRTRSHGPPGPMATLRFDDGTVRRFHLRYPHDPEQLAGNPTGMTETMRAIEAGQRLCESRGIRLLVVFIPIMVRVMAPEISFDSVEDKKLYLPERAGTDQKDFSATIEELCTRIGCSFVDSFAAFRQATANGIHDVYIPRDEHLDIGGHDVMARMIVAWLQSQKRP
jgi:hypothetical protein